MKYVSSCCAAIVPESEVYDFREQNTKGAVCPKCQNFCRVISKCPEEETPKKKTEDPLKTPETIQPQYSHQTTTSANKPTKTA